jgi:gas vesicle protein
MTPSLPNPPEVRSQQAQSAPRSMMSEIGQSQTESQNASVRAMQEMMSEVENISKSTLKVAQMADKILPAVMGDVAKMVEVGKSMTQQVQQAMQQMQQGSSTAPEQPPATSPTDALAPAAA